MIRLGSLLLLVLASALPAFAQDPGRKLVAAARAQVGVTRAYNGSYVTLAYPGGDIPRASGVCTDVVIRAFRDGLSTDLQQLVHEDMTSHFAAYPKNWGLSGPDANIDHRRVPNLQAYFQRRGLVVAASKKPSDFLPGDLVTCTVPPNLPHIMIVSDRKTDHGVPLVIHNIGAGAQEEDVLFTYPMTGHYRWSDQGATATSANTGTGTPASSSIQGAAGSSAKP